MTDRLQVLKAWLATLEPHQEWQDDMAWLIARVEELERLLRGEHAGNIIHYAEQAALDRAAEEIADGLLKEATVDDCIRWARDPASLVADAAAAIRKLKEPS
jgi:hypothetical protein